MARHGTPLPGTWATGPGLGRPPAPAVALTTRAVVRPAPWTPAPARPRPHPQRSLSAATSGKILVVAVAAGAVVPAVQTLDTTHTADADSSATTQLSSAQMALAAQNGPTARPASSAGSAISAVTTVAMSSDELESAASSGGVENLSKAISVARENGPVEFGRPYTAGSDKNLNGQIAKALGLLGLPQKLAPGVKQIIMRESTGKANAVNDWDSNAAAGTPSKGLMQLIDTTFRNAVLPSLADKGIFDPVANITAGIRTMVANHGLDALQDGGLRNSSGNYVGYGGAKLPDDGLGRAD